MQEEWTLQHIRGVVGVRMLCELRGISCIPLENAVEEKKIISTTRMFGKPVYTFTELKEAAAAYTSWAAEKLRRHGSAAVVMDVFAVSGGLKDERYHYDPESDHCYLVLPKATNLADELQKHAMPLVEQL
jgi:DNA polymerase V